MTRDCRSIGTSSGEVSGLREHCRNINICATNSTPDRPVLFFEFVSLATNSVTTSETPVPPNSCIETVTYLHRASAD